MGQMGFCENLRFSAVFCENLPFPAVFCENLRLQNAVIPRKSENLQKNQRKSANLALFVPGRNTCEHGSGPPGKIGRNRSEYYFVKAGTSFCSSCSECPSEHQDSLCPPPPKRLPN